MVEVENGTEESWRLVRLRLVVIDDEPQTRGKVAHEVCSSESLLSRSAHNQPVVEVLKNQHVLATEKSHNYLHYVSEDPRRGGEAEWQSSELEKYFIEAEAEELGVLRMYRDVQVGILQVDGGRPHWRNQGADNRPESLQAELLRADELVERAKVDNPPRNAEFLLGSKEEGGGEPAGLG